MREEVNRSLSLGPIRPETMVRIRRLLRNLSCTIPHSLHALGLLHILVLVSIPFFALSASSQDSIVSIPKVQRRVVSVVIFAATLISVNVEAAMMYRAGRLQLALSPRDPAK